LQHTSVDAPGSKFDNERDSEAGRDLLDAGELRQMVEHSQAVAITGTAPPVIFGFPPLSKSGPVAHPLPREVGGVIPLRNAEATFAKRQAKQASQEDPLPENQLAAGADISIRDESDTFDVNISRTIINSQSAAGVRPALMNMDANSILDRVARNTIAETGCETDLNQPRQP
jgi:hypothetical protein